MEKYLDTTLSPEERAADLLSKMSLEEKMAQTVSIFPMYTSFGGDSVVMMKDSCKNGIGSISTLEMRDLTSVEACREYQTRMQTMVMEQSPHHIPAMFHMEGLCGSFIQDSLSLPSGASRGAGWDPDLERKLAEVVSRQERAMGVTQILAPVLDVTIDPRMGRTGESYSEDPTLCAALGTAYTRGIQDPERPDGLKAESVAKHFLGFHNSLGGIHGSEGLAGPRRLDEIYGKPFQAAIKEANLGGIMPCYCSMDGEATSLSKRILTKLLRDEMGFDGIVCSDYGAISNAHDYDHLFETAADAGLAAMDAGMDMEWPNAYGYADGLKQMFADGTADAAILDRTVRRILEAKFRMGLFEHPFALEGESLAEEFYNEEDKALTLQAARQSLVLLKNDEALPLSSGIKKLAVIGGKADDVRILFGGYTNMAMTEAMAARRNSIAGIGTAGEVTSAAEAAVYPGTQVEIDDAEAFEAVAKRLAPGCRTIYQELKERFPGAEVVWSYGYPIAGNDTSHFAEALDAIRDADAAVLVLGGKWSSGSIATTGEGVDTVDINLPECQEKFIREAAALGKPLVGVHIDGRPISSDAADECLNAIVEAWTPAEAGAQAIADVLCGAVNPSGKLPVSVAYCAGQVPVIYNHPNGSSTHQAMSIGFADYWNCPHKARYAFGYGLSYTTFAYDNLSVETGSADGTVAPDGKVLVSFDVTNTGAAEGTEIVQVYLEDAYASMVRPCMELAGFARVDLAPGQTKRVTAEIEPSQMAFINLDMEWIIEKGLFRVAVGPASDNLPLRGEFTVTKTQTIDPRNRSFYAKMSQ